MILCVRAALHFRSHALSKTEKKSIHVPFRNWLRIVPCPPPLRKPKKTIHTIMLLLFRKLRIGYMFSFWSSLQKYTYDNTMLFLLPKSALSYFMCSVSLWNSKEAYPHYMCSFSSSTTAHFLIHVRSCERKLKNRPRLLHVAALLEIHLRQHDVVSSESSCESIYVHTLFLSRNSKENYPHYMLLLFRKCTSLSS
jgi:hypothetical protein